MSFIPPRPPVRHVYEERHLVAQLRELGVNDGDVLMVGVLFGQLGRLRKPGDQTLMNSLLQAVGPRGTLVGMTHSPVQWIFRRNPSYVYDPATAPCTNGRFAETIARWPGAFRSRHPTCSLTAIGPLARDLLDRHDHRANTHAPIKNLIDAGGKFVSLGGTVVCPGFSSIHYTYEYLGLANRSLLSGLIGCYFRNGNRVRWFNQRDIPGCSRGFCKFYPFYRARSVLHEGNVGDALSFLVNLGDAVQVESEAVRQCPTISLCDDPGCFSCRGTKLFNVADMPRFFLREVPRRIFKRLTRIAA